MPGPGDGAVTRRSVSTWLGLPTISGLAVAGLLGQSCQAGTPAVRTIQFSDGGHVTVERTREGERVDVVDRKGQSVSQSLCQDAVGSFDASATLFGQLQKAVAAGDKPAVAALIRFPLQVNGKTSEVITSSAMLLQRYGQIFNADVTRQIVVANPQAVFCRYDGNTFGDGAVWANTSKGKLAIVVINR